MKILFFVLFSFGLFATPLDVSVSAKSAILINADTGVILYEKHAHMPMYPASTTKIATALYILETKDSDLNRLVEVSQEALKMKPANYKGEVPSYWNEIEGSRMGLLKGEVLSVEALLHGLMKSSGNDAANVLAESHASSIPEFMNDLNKYLVEMGCVSTKFMNPHGLHHENHLTSAFDMSKIAQKAIKNSVFLQLVSGKSYRKEKTNKQQAIEIHQLNGLMRPGASYYPKAIGIKTGFHSASQANLVAAAEQNGRKLIAVLFGCPEKTGRYNDAIALFEKAFAEKMKTQEYFDPSDVFSYEVPGIKSLVKATTRESVVLSFFPSEEPEVKARLKWQIPALPVHKNQVVGMIELVNEQDQVLISQEIVSLDDQQLTFLEKVKLFFQ